MERRYNTYSLYALVLALTCDENLLLNFNLMALILIMVKTIGSPQQKKLQYVKMESCKLNHKGEN